MDGLCSHLSTSVDITMLISDFTGEHGIKYLKKLKEIAIEGSMVCFHFIVKVYSMVNSNHFFTKTILYS